MSARVEIPDASGELHDYDLRRLPPGPDLARYEVTRRDTGAAYLVRLTPDGLWECACPAWKYRRRRRSEHCKHTLNCQSAHQLVEALAQPEAQP